MDIVEAKVEQAPELSEFLNRVVYDHLKEIDEQKARNLASRYSDVMLRDRIRKSRVWIARMSGRIVGTVTLDGNEIKGMYVDSALRRKGVGRELLEEAIQYARESDFPGVFVETNEIAQKFFKSNGFAVVEKMTKVGDKGEYDWFRMQKKLG